MNRVINCESSVFSLQIKGDINKSAESHQFSGFIYAGM